MNKLLKYKKFFPLLSGILIVFSFPPFKIGFLAWFALVPLISSLYEDDFHLGFGKGFIYGMVLNLGILYWLGVNQGTEWYFSSLSMISAVLFLAVFHGLATALVGLIGRKVGKFAGVLAFPFVFTAMEWLRSIGSLAFTWNNLCYTQSPYLVIIQIVSVLGPLGVSLWIYSLNSMFFLLLIERRAARFRLITISTIVFMFPVLFGTVVLLGARANKDKNKEIIVTVVQPNMDPNEKWGKEFYQGNMDKLFHLSEQQILDNKSELLVWPETAVPTYLRINRRNSLVSINDFVKKHGTPIMTGAPDYGRVNKEYTYYNSLFFIDGGNGKPENYRKMHLVPFGEYIPLSETFEDLKKLNLGQGNFIAGDEITIFKLKKNDYSINMTAAICFDSGFSDLIRQGVKKGSQLLAVVTNDAWFGNTSAPYLHGEISRFRAVENHIPVARAANTGISMIIDKYGRVLKNSKFNEEIALTATVEIGEEKTFYSQTGNWIGALCVIVMSVLVMLTFIRRNNEK